MVNTALPMPELDELLELELLELDELELDELELDELLVELDELELELELELDEDPLFFEPPQALNSVAEPTIKTPAVKLSLIHI